MNFDKLLHPDMDAKIKARLRLADQTGTMHDVAIRTGIAGGSTELRKIMNTEGELAIMDRGMLGMLLEIRP